MGMTVQEGEAGLAPPNLAWVDGDTSSVVTSPRPSGADHVSEVRSLSREWSSLSFDFEERGSPAGRFLRSHQQVLQGLLVLLALGGVAFITFVDESDGNLILLLFFLLLVVPLTILTAMRSMLLPPLVASQVPLVASWCLCVILTLSAPGRKFRLVGEKDRSHLSGIYCEEGSTAMWLTFTLAATIASFPVGPKQCCGFFLAVALQYLGLGLALPRPECESGGDAVESHGSLLLLHPLTIGVIQLLLLEAALASLVYQLGIERKGGFEVHRFETTAPINSSDASDGQHGDDSSDGEGNKGEFVVHTNLEKLVADIEREEWRWRLFLDETQSSTVEGTCSHYWSSAVRALVDEVSNWHSRLRSQATGLMPQIDGKQIMDAMNDADCNIDSVSQFVDTTAVHTRKFANVQEGSPFTNRRMYPLQTIPGLSADLKIGEWDFNAIEVNSERSGHILQVVGFELLRVFRFLQRDLLTTFLEKLEGKYSPNNPYHSHIHAADMCNSFFFLMSKCGLWRNCELPEACFAAMLLAACGHDVGHFGRTNMFLVTRRHELAITYNDRSVLESMHASCTIRLTEDVKDGAKLLQQLPAEQVTKCRQLIVTLILATDTQKHLDELASFRVRLGADTFDPFADANDQQATLCMLFRAADIGHSAKAWEMHEEWSKRVSEEFHQQGDEEKRLGLKVSPLCDRENFKFAASQSGFLQFICLPTWREIARLEEAANCARGMGTGSRSSNTSPGNTSRQSRARTPRTRRTVAAAMRVGTPDTQASRKDSADRISKTSVVPMPRDSGSSVAGDSPTTSTGNSGTVPGGVPGGAPPTLERRPSRKVLGDACLNHCEDNFQFWKAMVEADRASSESGSRVPSRQDTQNSPRPQSRTGTGSSSASAHST